ncbi:hypothetical protein JK202_16095 [Gluconobacter sp. Dm-62]|uniref:hypothetical protein n=1 Tax=Gluconobacter sp. Dm-62 TaxID=2799804 RepID=UPI001B8D1828|nr:hypothetical protein [Gluconobacter sp. Dm-62]MBS1104483.1 hypothetical protein [Gluconobacter sp. Dm-62]
MRSFAKNKKILFRAGQEWIPFSVTIERRLVLEVTDWEIIYVQEKDPFNCTPRVGGKSNFRVWIKYSKAIEINTLDQTEDGWYDNKPEWIKKRLHVLGSKN